MSDRIWRPDEIGGKGADGSVFDRAPLRGVSVSRQKGVKTAECAGCGRTTQDFITYDAGPDGRVPTIELRRAHITVNFCVVVRRDRRGYAIGEPYGCAFDYVEWVRAKIESGTVEKLFMHDLVRMFCREKNPTIVFPDTAEFAKGVPKL